MKAKRPPSLTGRLFRASLATTALALVVLSLAFTLYQYERRRDATLEEAAAIADILSQNLGAAIVFGNRQAATEVLRALEIKPDVSAAFVFDPEGALFVDYGSRDLAAAFAGENGAVASQRLRDGHLLVSRPVLAGGELAGSLGLVIRMENLGAWLGRAAGILLPVLVTAMILAALIARELVREILRPLHRLVEALRRVGTPGCDPDPLPTNSAGRELAALYTRFNELVAEIKRQRRLLAESETRYRSIVETQSEAICRLDSNLQVQFVNLAFSQAVGPENADLLGAPPWRLFPDEDRQVIEGALARLSPEATIQEFDCRLRGTDGLRWIHARLRGLFDLRGKPIEYLLVARDISEKKIAEEMAVQASKLATLGEISTSIAHELKQPLAVIDLAVQNMRYALDDETLTPKEQLQYLNDKIARLGANSERIRTIIDHLRVFGRKVNDDGYGAFDARESVKAAIMLIQHRLEQAGILLRNRTAVEGPAPVRGHPILFEQVLLNLLSNSIDAIEGQEPRPGESGRPFIEIGFERGGSSLGIVIEDSGGGIPEQFLARATERYFTTKPPGKGTGLGLAISKDILARMGGRLRLQHGKQGLRVVIELPEKASDESSGESAVA